MCHTEKTARRLGDDSKTQARKVHKNSNDKMKAKTRKTQQYVSTLQSAIPPATPSIRAHEHHIPDARTWAEHRRGKCQIATKRKQNRQIAPESGSRKEEMCIFAASMRPRQAKHLHRGERITAKKTGKRREKGKNGAENKQKTGQKQGKKQAKNRPMSLCKHIKALFSEKNAKKCKKIHGFLCAKTGLTDYAFLLFYADTLPAHLQHISI